MVSDTLADAQPSTDALAGKLARTELLHEPSSIPGREIVQVLTEIPVGVESGWHTHPGEEVGYIVAGTVEMMVDGRRSSILHAGDGFLIPPGTRHNALDVGPGIGRMLSTYVVEVGLPLVTLVMPSAMSAPPVSAVDAEEPVLANTYRLHLRSDEFEYEHELRATAVDREDGWTLFWSGEDVFMRIRDEHIVSLEHLI